jgi:heparin/heparan-sulfate lyase
MSGEKPLGKVFFYLQRWGKEWRLVAPALCILIPAHVCNAAGDSWMGSIRPDHPRLFFNRETWPAVKARALGEEHTGYDRLKERVDRYPDTPAPASAGDDFAYRKKEDGTYETVRLPRPTEWGIQAAQTAFVYLVTGEGKYLARAKKMLEASVRAYHECYEKGMTVNWYSTSRVHWIAAFDWLYNDLSPEERRSLMGSFLMYLENLQPRPDRPQIYRQNDSDHTTGFYGDRNLLWFAGLAAYRDGIDDERALRFLKLGYQYNRDLFAYRAECAGDDGGLATTATNYSMGAYPWSQFNFMYTWRSATGRDIAAEWPHLAYFPVWIRWNMLPGPAPREFGMGDTYHYDNILRTSLLYTHMTQIMDFYSKSQPGCAALASHVRELVPEKERRHNATFFFYPFLLTGLTNIPPLREPLDNALHARHFETLGQIFMRSGTGADDTYCLFAVGCRIPSHKQHDENNFIIYKKGYLALDSGTRAAETDTQLRHYYSQTVAHNCMLIHMPGEPFPGYWGMAYEGPEGQVSCGGTCRTNGGKCVAFETNDTYTYVAGDATPCYRPEKCALALRQMIFVMPNHFIICDRVTSTVAAYKKDWLLHTQNEPSVSGDTFRVDHEEGRLFCRTIYPPDATLAKVGGPGREFWTCGRNWEYAPDVVKMVRERYNGGILGNWRMEVSPGAPRKEDVFLHLIQVGDQSLSEMSPAELIEKNGMVGVRFRDGNRIVEARFARRGKAAGHITVISENKTVLNRDLSGKVQPQKGLEGK